MPSRSTARCLPSCSWTGPLSSVSRLLAPRIQQRLLLAAAPWAVSILIMLIIPAQTFAGSRSVEPTAAVAELLKRALPGEDLSRPRDGGELFRRVLDSELFASGAAGPFKVHVLMEDSLSNAKRAKRLRDDLVASLEPAAALVKRLWPAGGAGLISAAELPLVITDSSAGEPGFHALIELLDYCERLGYSGWHPANEVDTPAQRVAEVVRTWDVQVFNMAHSTISGRRARWVEHGVGYYALAFVANRSLRRGAWGLVPPWLANGLIDELDIAAHGKAWVGQESWTRQTPGWYRAGWSGFVPKGSSPPPPVTGPPANLAVTVSKTGDPWLSFDASESRHWSDLASDRKTEAPASFSRAADAESFLPRDRAAARCLLHLLLSTTPSGVSLTSLLDTPVNTPRDGMPDSEALPVLLAQAMGGVAEVEALESASSRDVLTEIGRSDLIEAFSRLGASAALDLKDHREQSLWLSRQAQFDSNQRLQLFNLILEAEYEQQMAEWKRLAPHLDLGLEAALDAGKRFPSKQRDLKRVAEAFREGLLADPALLEQEDSGKSRKSKRSKRR